MEITSESRDELVTYKYYLDIVLAQFPKDIRELLIAYGYRDPVEVGKELGECLFNTYNKMPYDG